MDTEKLESYYSEVSGFTKLLCDTWHMMENADDLDEVPAEVKDQLQILPMHTIAQVLEKTGIKERQAERETIA